MKKILFISCFLCSLSLLAQKKVGIGTTSPAQRLSVDSTLNIDQGNYDDGTKPSLRFGDAATGEAIGSRRLAGGSNPFGLDFYSGGTKRMVISNSGNIGIGTDVPQAALSVNGDVLVDYNATNNGVAGFSLRFGNASSGEGISSARSGSINPLGLSFFTNFITRVSITQTGKMGVGQTNPIAQLHVKSQEQVVSFTEGTNPFFVLNGINADSINAVAGTVFLRQGVTKAFTGINTNNDLVVATSGTSGDILFGSQFAGTITERMRIKANGFAGIGTSNPGFPLDVFDVNNTGFIAGFSSNNSTNTIVQINNNAPGSTATTGIGLYRNGISRGYFYLDAVNNLNITTTGSAQLTVSPAGNVGIGISNAGFPLNFAPAIGEKISLYGNSGNNYGIGIQNLLLQLHTDIATADIAFGYGSSASFTETMRIKGNGNLLVTGDMITDVNGTNNGFAFPGLRFGASNSGEAISSKRTAGGNQNGLDLYTNGAPRLSIDNSGLVGINGNTTPGARLQINQAGNYNTNENSTHALEIWDNNEILYMGADASTSISYIQAVGQNLFHTLTLNARGGNVAIGKATAAEKLDVNGNGAFNGNLTVQTGKGIVRNYTGTQLKTETFTFTFPGLLALGANNTASFNVSFPEAYTSVPMVYVSGLVSNAGSGGYAECVYNIASVSSTGFTLYIYNPRPTGATFNNGTPNFQVNFVALGAQ